MLENQMFLRIQIDVGDGNLNIFHPLFGVSRGFLRVFKLSLDWMRFL